MARQQVEVLPDALRILRTRLDGTNRSQETLAKEASKYAPVSPSLVHAIEQGRRSPSLVTAYAIARALNVPVGAFCKVLVPLSLVDGAA